MKRRLLLITQRILIGLVILMSHALVVFEAQGQTTGTIYGRVSDEAGAVIVSAVVTAIDLQRGRTRITTTDSEGSFRFDLMPVGKYRIGIERAGFSHHGEEVELQVQANLRVDAKLKIGVVDEQVVVATGNTLVDTVSTTLGKVVERKEIVELPLSGRNFLQLSVLQAGIAPLTPGVTVTSSGTNQSPGGTPSLFSVNGMRFNSNNHLLDGVNNTEPVSGAAMIIPSLDALQEFRILTNMYNAEFGRGGGSIVTVLTKTGTNRFSGSVFEFLRNDVFDARNFFSPEVPELKQNQFGFTLGGPILKDRTFFFGSYEGFRQRKGLAIATSVPSLLFRQGDFSQATIKPIDPMTGQPFPGDVIPSDRVDPVARRVIELWPTPNVGDSRWSGAPSGSNDRDQFMVRLDHTLLEGKNTLTGRYLFDRGSAVAPIGASAGARFLTEVPGFEFGDFNRFQNLMIADVHVFSPSVINDFRFSYQRSILFDSVPAEPKDHKDFGFTFPVASSLIGFPSVVVTGFSSLGQGSIHEKVSNFYQFGNHLALQTGSHSLKFGGDARHTRMFNVHPSRAWGSFTFNGLVTGNAFADYLLGKPFVFFQAGGREDKTGRQTTYYFYGQDSFRVRTNLTLNLGLRYELSPNFTDTDDLMVGFKPGVQSVLSPTLPTGLFRGGDPGIPRTVYPTEKKNFAPRLGLAWDPFRDGKTSIRAGYGVFYDDSSLIQSILIFMPPDLQGFISTVLSPSFADPFLGASPFTAPIQFPIPVTPGSETAAISPDFKLARIHHWNLTVQRQLTRSFGVEVAYVGNKGTRLQGSIDANEPIWRPGATAGDANSRRPLPAFGSAFVIAPVHSSDYHGLQVTAMQRLSHGLSFLASYTRSKAIDTATTPVSFINISGQSNRPQNSLDLASERGLSAFDVRNRFVVSYIYELPFFRHSTSAARHVLGGWRLTGITSLQSGYPFTVVDSLAPSGNPTSVVADRPDLIRNPNLPSGQRTPERWFDTSAFQRFTPSLSRNPPNFGNAGRNIVFTDGIANFDMGLTRLFKLGEEKQIEFRWEVFNVFNHPNFGVPRNDINAAEFGRVLNTSTSERIMQFGFKFLF